MYLTSYLGGLQDRMYLSPAPPAFLSNQHKKHGKYLRSGAVRLVLTPETLRTQGVWSTQSWQCLNEITYAGLGINSPRVKGHKSWWRSMLGFIYYYLCVCVMGLSMCPGVPDLCNTSYLFCMNATLAAPRHPQLSWWKERVFSHFTFHHTTQWVTSSFDTTSAPWEAPPPVPSQPATSWSLSGVAVPRAWG